MTFVGNIIFLQKFPWTRLQIRRLQNGTITLFSSILLLRHHDTILVNKSKLQYSETSKVPLVETVNKTDSWSSIGPVKQACVSSIVENSQFANLHVLVIQYIVITGKCETY